jgi:glycosyltransferase involved in cell wall biosynthesis
MKNKNLVIINNEKIFKKDFFYCDNIDMQSIPEDLNKDFRVTVIARSSKIKRERKIDLSEIKVASNIFSFFYNTLKTFNKNEVIYLIISITPYTFLTYLFLFLFRKKVFVYLRSNGYEEYKEIIGFLGPIIYYFMLKIVSFKSKIITCQERLFSKEKSNLVHPSELNFSWLQNLQDAPLNKPKLLYVGRARVEKGIFSMIKIFNEIKSDIQLSIVARMDENPKIKNFENIKKINFLGHGFDSSKLIPIYDDHNIFILPSYTEAHPKVLDESLARGRPVIIFEEIKHVIQNRKGIFVSKRNSGSFLETINYIIKNYKDIQEEMKKNKLPTRKDFILQMRNILNSNL